MLGGCVLSWILLTLCQELHAVLSCLWFQMISRGSVVYRPVLNSNT